MPAGQSPRTGFLSSRDVILCRLPLAACRLPLAACRLPLAACRLPLAACRLPLAACRLPLAACRLPSPSPSPSPSAAVYAHKRGAQGGGLCRRTRVQWHASTRIVPGQDIPLTLHSQKSRAPRSRDRQPRFQRSLCAQTLQLSARTASSNGKDNAPRSRGNLLFTPATPHSMTQTPPRSSMLQTPATPSNRVTRHLRFVYAHKPIARMANA